MRYECLQTRFANLTFESERHDKYCCTSYTDDSLSNLVHLCMRIRDKSMYVMRTNSVQEQGWDIRGTGRDMHTGSVATVCRTM